MFVPCASLSVTARAVSEYVPAWETSISYSRHEFFPNCGPVGSSAGLFAEYSFAYRSDTRSSTLPKMSCKPHGFGFF
jgi:hypothetical protein